MRNAGSLQILSQIAMILIDDIIINKIMKRNRFIKWLLFIKEIKTFNWRLWMPLFREPFPPLSFMNIFILQGPFVHYAKEPWKNDGLKKKIVRSLPYCWYTCANCGETGEPKVTINFERLIYRNYTASPRTTGLVLLCPLFFIACGV